MWKERGTVGNENLVLRVGMLLRFPVFGSLHLGSARERGGGIVGLGPASEPLLTVAFESVGQKVQGCAAARGAPRDVFAPLTPPLFQFYCHKASLAHWPPGEPPRSEGTCACGFASERRVLSGAPDSC